METEQAKQIRRGCLRRLTAIISSHTGRTQPGQTCSAAIYHSTLLELSWFQRSLSAGFLLQNAVALSLDLNMTRGITLQRSISCPRTTG